MMTLLEHDMTGPYKDLEDSNIKLRHMQTNLLDCVELYTEGFTEICIYELEAKLYFPI